MRKTVRYFSLAIVILLILTCKQQTPEPGFSFNDIYFFAIQEDVARIIRTINSIPNDSLTAEQKEVREKYILRFSTSAENIDFGTNDSLIINVLSIFQSYWGAVLMKKESIGTAEGRSGQLLIDYLSSYNNRHKELQNINLTRDNMVSVLSDLLKQNGFYSRIDRTGNIMDLIIWTSQYVETYSINIADTIVNVPVVFIDSTVTLGWEGYATFGYFYPGGWTSGDTLYCIKKDYDITSEKFRVSYLTHETQHLLDAKTYSGYPVWMAEYRAKLAELSTAETTIYNLIGAFIKGSENDSRLTHPYAENKLLRKLSGEIFKEKFVTDLTRWQSVPFRDINLASQKLLQQNSNRLTKK